MANFYLDISAIGNEYQAYASAMTIGALATDKPLPMDGSGKVQSGASASVAMTELLITQPTAGNAIGIAGATALTAVAAYTAKNQFLIGADAAATAATLVTCINTYGTATNVPNCDVTVVTTVSALALAVPYMYWARIKPGASSTIQLFTRIADAAYNTATTASSVVTQTGTWINGGSNGSFTGGANGPFGYFVTNATVFGKTSKTYGLMTASKVASVLDPGAATDAILVRTMRSAANLTLALTDTSTRYDWTIAPTTTNRQFVFDDGTTWAGDAGLFTLSLTNPAGFAGGATTIQSSAATVSFTSLSGRRFRLYVAHPSVATAVYGYNMTMVAGSTLIFDGIVIEEDAAVAGTSQGLYISNSNNAAPKFQFSNSNWIAHNARQIAYFGTNPGARYQYSNSEFEYFGLTANVSGIVNAAGAGNDQYFEAIGCKFYDRNGVYSVVSPVTGSMGSQAAQRIVFDGCSGISGVTSAWTAQLQDYNRLMTWENMGPYRDWRIEVGAWLAEWRYGQNHPTLTSTLQNGAPWSARVLLRNIMVWGVPQRPFKVNGYYRDATEVKTIKLDFLAQQTFAKAQLGILVAYIDTIDVVRYEHTLESRGKMLAGLGANVPTSGVTWTLNGQTGFTAYKLELMTTYAIKTGTDFTVYVLVNGTVASDQTLYFNGEVTLT